LKEPKKKQEADSGEVERHLAGIILCDELIRNGKNPDPIPDAFVQLFSRFSSAPQLHGDGTVHAIELERQIRAATMCLVPAKRYIIGRPRKAAALAKHKIIGDYINEDTV
jgi:hypothetical protein